ncbi:hypothetical protein HK099_000481 [Clydaea vesicula]|uniref:Mitochondrial carrier protein n=1 Tax=Clydaea vesicula TaxID=447962 RepID=A0AAD5Y012_9FUNG|nr:hypothetical protein HK099_000481 [Clydaea vesicula]
MYITLLLIHKCCIDEDSRTLSLSSVCENRQSICVRNKITRATFYNWRKQWDESGIVKPLKKTGPKLILDKESKQELIEFFNKYPTATNEDGSIHVSNKIKPRTMSVSDEPENYLDERILQETKDYLDIIKNIPNETRVYMDESFVYDNEAPRYGRSISGQRKSRPRKRHGKRWTFYLALRLNGISRKFLDYVRNTLVPNLQEGELVIWDRLGKAGRCKNPKKQHYNPEAKALIEAKEQGLYFYHHKERTLKTNIRISYTLSDAGKEKRARTDSGAIAGLSVDILLFPLDTIKTRLQSQFGNFSTKSLYNGLQATVLGSAPSAAMFFLTYDQSKKLIFNNNETPLSHVVSSSLAEFNACVYKNLKDAVIDVKNKKEFYRGFYMTLFRDIPFSVLQFCLWEDLKKSYSKYKLRKIKPWESAICGSLAGAFAAFSTTPLDVVKTRIMLEKKNCKEYNSIFSTIKRIHSKEGMGAFFKGVGPRVLWIGVGGFIFLGTYEKVKKTLEDISSP